MEIKLSVDQEVARIHMQGRFDFASHVEFRQACSKALALAVNEVQLDLAGVVHLDSAGLGLMLMMRDRCLASARKLALLQPPHVVLSIFNLGTFSRLFEVQ